MVENFRATLTWVDVLIGMGSCLVISLLLVGFRFQTIPELKVGEIANQEVRALQDVTYIDQVATEQKRQDAIAAIPAVYEMDTALIVGRLAELSKAFSLARAILAQSNLPAEGALSGTRREQLLEQLERDIGGMLPPNIVRVLLDQRFSPVLEGQILKVLDTVMRAGIVADLNRFAMDRRSGILVRDSTTPAGRLVTQTYMARDVPAAREFLRQFHLEFSTLPAQDRFALLQFLETLLSPTLLYQERETTEGREAAAAQVRPVETQIRQGKTIVRVGEEVTETVGAHLEALRNLQRPRSVVAQLLGFFFFVAVFLYTIWRYFVYYQTRHRKIRNHTLLIVVIVAGVLVAMRLMTALADILGERMTLESFKDPSTLYYAMPFAFGAVLVALLVDINLGIIVSMMIGSLIGLFYGDIYLSAYVLMGSFAGIYSIRQYKDRAAILKAGLTIGIANFAALIGIGFLQQHPFTLAAVAGKAGIALTGGMLTSALVSMLLPALEALFKITTDIRLIELSNLNAPVLRRLSVDAPGTYHHSLMVGNLAEAAADAVEANPLLVRVGAYYHDIGKMLKPEYFVENQLFGINKHENLSPSMSCLIIASHVKDGLELAKEIGLAQRIRDMIPQHHGTRVMTYFYQKAKDLHEVQNQEVLETDFRYPGPKPQSKEAAIIMMADSVEAASRTLSNPTAVQIQGMINRLVDAIVADSQLDECDITMRDIRLVKLSFFKVLTGLYHRRIDYPGYDFREDGREAERTSLQNSGSRQAKAV
jgi:putative nucleotidyltransferase with HDIG domain